MTKASKSLLLSSLLATLVSGCFELPSGSSIGQLVLAEQGAYICTPDDAAHIAIPPGALAADTRITIEQIDPPAELADQQIVEPVFDFGPDGTRFSEPVWVQLHPGRLPDGMAITELSLFNYSDGVVEELTDVTVDPVAGTISGFTTHFSVFYAAYSGPVAGRGIRVGGPNMTPLFGASNSATNPTNVPIWVAPGGEISTNPYSGETSDVLVIQVDTDPPIAGSSFYIEGWTVSPVDPEGTVGPTGDRISTRGFWHDFFAREIETPMRNLRTDADGRLTLVIRGDRLYAQMLNAPPGYSDGRLRLRVFDPEAADAVDIQLSFSRLR